MSCHKVRVVELEMPLVVELGEGGTEGVLLLEVDVVNLRLGGRVPAVLTHIHLQVKCQSNAILCSIVSVKCHLMLSKTLTLDLLCL